MVTELLRMREFDKRNIAMVWPGQVSRCQEVDGYRAGGITRCLPVETGSLPPSAADAQLALHNCLTAIPQLLASFDDTSDSVPSLPVLCVETKSPL